MRESVDEDVKQSRSNRPKHLNLENSFFNRKPMTGALTGPHFPSGDKRNQVSTTPSPFLGFSVTIWLILG